MQTRSGRNRFSAVASSPFSPSRRTERTKCRPRSLFVGATIAALVSLNIYGLHTLDLAVTKEPNLKSPARLGNYEWASKYHEESSDAKEIDWKANGNFALWTYPVEPPQHLVVHPQETLICAYRPCREYAGARNISLASLNLAQILPLATGLEPAQALNFRRFLDDQYWYKLQYGLEFPHHVQSVAFLSIAAIRNMRESSFCIRSIPYDTTVCGNATSSHGEEYDPTSDNPSMNTPLFRDAGLNFNATRFGTLGYDGRVGVVKVANSGDEMQGFAGVQFLPYLTDFVDRDFGLPDTTAEHLFANAWWGYSSAFPPPDSLKAAWFSVHMSSKFQKETVPRNIEYFRKYVSEVGPIGARDYPTLIFLQKLGLPAYPSSCFTQMMKPNRLAFQDNPEPKDLIMLVDVDPTLLPQHIVERGRQFVANVNESHIYDRQLRLKHAHDLHQLYSSRAKVVITSRIHSALPASVSGVPVIFVEMSEDRLPGGKGGRTAGISDLFHTYSPESGGNWTFDVDHMPPNPGVHRQDRYRASFWNYIKNRLPAWYLDTAKLFGLLPLRRLGQGVDDRSVGEVHELFHFIYTTPATTLTWRVQRAIEAVFFHHPNARVIMHSRSLSLQGTRLDVFSETGYNFEIQPYDLKQLLTESDTVSKTDLQALLGVLDTRRTGEYWYSHETDLLRLLIMEKYGGVYLDTDVHVIKPFPRSLRNVLGYQDRLTTKRALKLALTKKLNGAVMIFERSNLFLKKLIVEAINRLVRFYKPNDWGMLGPNLLSDVWRAHEKDSRHASNVKILDSDAFYPYTFGNAHDCFAASAVKTPVNRNTYAVHLNTKVTSDFQAAAKGSYCDTMFRTFCIFCDEIYTAEAISTSFFS